MTPQRLSLIVDGNNLAHKCRHVFSLSNSQGVDVSVTFGFLKVLGSMLGKFQPDSVVVCWDGGIPEFRRIANPEYKANRDKGDPLEYEDFLRQVRELTDYALPMTGILSIYKGGAEADDLMYHASRIIQGKSLIATSDKDLLQAITLDGRVQVYSKDKIYGDAEVLEEYGIHVNQIVDWRALQGDSSDNILGVMGIGEKTATKLFNEYKSLTGITNAACGRNPQGTITGKIGESIKQFGFDRIAKNIFIMALYADRVGAKAAIVESVKSWQPADKIRLKKYLLHNSFATLLDGEFIGGVARLSQPRLVEDIRIPVYCSKRIPV